MTTFTYREIFDALASEGIACRQENMGGGCAALAVNAADGARIIVGNGEWMMGESLGEEVRDGTVSVLTESAEGIYSGDSDRYTLCTSGYGVLAVVSALLNGGVMECDTVGCPEGAHHVFDIEENTRRDYDPCPTFTCPSSN